MDLSYRIPKFILNSFFKLVSNLEVNNAENIPEGGSVIVVANHISNYDPPVLSAALPRQLRFMAKEELFKNPIMNKFLRYYGNFPVKRGKGDMSAIREALNILKQEQVLGLFPEGSRSKDGELKQAKLGAVVLAIKSEAPILPVGLNGTQNPFRSKIKVNVGKAFMLDKYYDHKLDKAEMREVGRIIMSKIEQLLI